MRTVVDILHQVGVAGATPEEVYDALTTLDGLAGWWTVDTTGETRVDGVIRFRFGAGGLDMRVEELVPGRLVRWRDRHRRAGPLRPEDHQLGDVEPARAAVGRRVISDPGAPGPAC